MGVGGMGNSVTGGGSGGWGSWGSGGDSGLTCVELAWVGNLTGYTALFTSKLRTEFSVFF